jgi:hypothetical protein
MEQSFVKLDVHTTCRGKFLKACLFFRWLAVRLHNFELTQSREEKKEIA